VGARDASAFLIPRLAPEPLSNRHRLDFCGLPPRLFIAAPMQIPVVDAAQRHGELVTDFAPKGARLPKPDVMGIGRAPAADETGL
jgi:hypothetical protein